jgi:hypothetical protein
MHAHEQPVGTVVTILLLSIAAFSLYTYEQATPTYMQTAHVGSAPYTAGVPDTWQTVTSTRYNITVSYPPHWQVSTTSPDTGGIAPVLSVHPAEQTADLSAPYYHFDNATHVSIYPHGIPTGALLAPRVSAQAVTGPDFTDARALLMGSSTAFAYEAVAPMYPAQWKPWGFLFARVYIADMAITCRVPSASDHRVAPQCPPFLENRDVHRAGDLDFDTRRTVVRVMQSITFTTSTRPVAGTSRDG